MCSSDLEDNADKRLAAAGRGLGLLGEQKWRQFCVKQENIERTTSLLKETYLYPKEFEENPSRFESAGIFSLRDRLSLFDLLRRPEWSIARLKDLGIFGFSHDEALPAWQRRFVDEAVEVGAKYEGYIKREMELLEKVSLHESKPIPADFSFRAISGLSIEVVERLERVRPSSLGQALRVPGITPAAGALLFVHLEKGRSNLPRRETV